MSRTACALAFLMGMAGAAFGRPGTPSFCDLNQDGVTDVTDVQLVIREALGMSAASHDLNRDGMVNVVDIQVVVGAAKGLGCPADVTILPSIVSITPASGMQGQDLTVTVSARNTHFSSATALDLGPGITVVSTTPSNATTFSAEFKIDAATPPGQYAVVVTTGGEVVTAPAAFTVQPAVSIPTILSVSPTTVAVGATPTITIAGFNTHFQQGVSTVNLGADITVESVTVSSATSLQAVLALPTTAVPGARGITVQTGQESAVLAQGLAVVGSDLTISIPAEGAYLLATTTQVTGQVADPAAVITVNGIVATNSGGNFSATIPLVEGLNTVTAISRSAGGALSSTTIHVTLDLTPPQITVLSPRNSDETTEATISVAGTVNDIVLGTVNEQDATVSVNGIAAQVANRSFVATGVPLAAGANTISVTATDRAGNAATARVSITRVMTPLVSLQVVSGNSQAGPVLAFLPNPLVVRFLDSSGQPRANQPVTFQVTGNDAMVALQPGATPAAAVQVNTDAQGRAQAYMKLGTRSGSGNNRVEAFATGVTAPAVFTLTGTATAATMLLVDSGQNQTGTVGGALDFPFVAVATDAGFNRLPNLPVTFTVIGGGGSLGGAGAVTVNTDSNGRAAVTLQLGGAPGSNNNVVVASLSNPQVQPAVFSASGLEPVSNSDTSIAGVVLANNGDPIVGATIHLLQTNQGTVSNLPVDVAPTSPTNAQGQFLMPTVPTGLYKLMVDGTTATGAAKYPPLEFDITTVMGQQNSVGSPIYLPALDQVNSLCVNATTGGTLTLPAVPGFSLTVAPGSATFPGGSKQGCVTVTPVNLDKIPMAPGFGQQPRFVVTIQPVGTSFNPPAALSIPNVDGLPPRAVTEMYSYDHDLGAFVAIGTGTVSVDGRVIQSDPGVGVVKAGWHCGGNPASSGAAGQCQACYTCVGQGCVVNPAPAGCDDHNYCTSCNGTGPGGDCCIAGKCTGNSWGNTVTGQISESLAPAFDIFNQGSALLNALLPCRPEFKFSGGFSEQIGTFCCNNPQGIQAGRRLAGTLNAALGVTCFYGVVLDIPLWVPVDNHYGGKAGLTFTIGASGSVTGSGTQGACKECNKSLSGSASFGISLGVQVQVAGDFIDASCSASGFGFTVSGDYNLCNGVSRTNPVCVGPIVLSCSITVGALISVNVSYTLTGKVCH